MKNKPRNCVEVINQMLVHIPSDKKELIKALEYNKVDASIKAPEEVIQWHRTSQTLQEYIQKPIEDWEFMVLSIFSTMTIDEIKRSIYL